MQHSAKHFGRSFAIVGALGLASALALSACAPKPTARSGSTESRAASPRQAPTLRLEPNAAEEERLAIASEAAASADYATALRIFRDLLAENPTLVDAHAGMGSVLEEQGELELAESSYARATRLDPTNFMAASGHGRVLEALGQFKLAVRAVQRALVARPADVDANLAMARLLLATGQAEGSIAFAERATRLAPDNGFAHLALARAYSRVGRGRDAIRQYETAVELIDPPADVMLALINAYGEEKRFQEAANAAEALTRTSPSAAAFERHGWALFRLGDFDGSDRAYRMAIELDPAYWPALNGVGVNALNLWIKNGRDAKDPLRDEARLMLQRSMRANPDQPKVAGLLLKYRL